MISLKADCRTAENTERGCTVWWILLLTGDFYNTSNLSMEHNTINDNLNIRGPTFPPEKEMFVLPEATKAWFSSETRTGHTPALNTNVCKVIHWFADLQTIARNNSFFLLFIFTFFNSSQWCFDRDGFAGKLADAFKHNDCHKFVVESIDSVANVCTCLL